MGNCKGCGVYLKDDGVVCPICGFIPSMTSNPSNTPSVRARSELMMNRPSPMQESRPSPMQESRPSPMQESRPSPMQEYPDSRDLRMQDDTSTPDHGEVPNKNGHTVELTPGMRMEVDHLIRRGKECLDVANAYRSAGNRTTARQNFQRAFAYFDEALKIDPSDPMAKQFKESVVRKLV